MSDVSLVKMIGDVIIPFPKPAVYVSGGLDSTIILHHLTQKTDEKIYTYTAKFNVDGDEIMWSRMVAEYYRTVHKEVDCSRWLEMLPKILEGLTHPRYNVWGYFLALLAKEDGRKNVYIGEGSDEHFGGYDTKPYLNAWADHFVYIRQMYEEIHKKFELNVYFPFDELDWKETIKYYSPPNKYYLREVYSGILPNFIIEGRKKLAPAFSNYWQIWYRYVRKYFPGYQPESEEDIRKLMRYLAVKAWMEANKGDYECRE